MTKLEKARERRDALYRAYQEQPTPGSYRRFIDARLGVWVASLTEEAHNDRSSDT